MAGVTSAHGFHMRMGGSSCSVSAGGDTASSALGLHGCESGSGSCSVFLPKRSAQRLWIAAILFGNASWTPFMASTRRRVPPIVCNWWPLWPGQGLHDAGIGTCL